MILRSGVGWPPQAGARGAWPVPVLMSSLLQLPMIAAYYTACRAAGTAGSILVAEGKA